MAILDMIDFIIQIQHLLKLNSAVTTLTPGGNVYSNTTLVKVKLELPKKAKKADNSNTTLVKVKFYGCLYDRNGYKFKYNTC